ncbi:MAG TPA: hypothetical protein VIJ51_00450 [Solirubrobacteraceae bacterium]
MKSTAEEGETRERGKRVSWVELYLDLVFVLAIGELVNLISRSTSESVISAVRDQHRTASSVSLIG